MNNPIKFKQVTDIFSKLMTKLNIKIIISAGAIAVTINHFSHPPVNSQNQRSEQSTQTQLRSFNRTQYEQLRIGMSLTDVRATISNPGVEVSRSSTVATFVWENPDDSKITATFENDKLKSKEQSRLK